MTNLSEKDQTNFEAALLALSLDRDGGRSLQQQLSTGLRQLILSGRAAPGVRLPPSRILAAELSVSRSTTLAALEQLTAEGYLEARQGSGTFVARDLPPQTMSPSPVPTDVPEVSGARPVQPFHPGMPDSTAFPHTVWARCLEQVWRKPHPDLLKLADPMGWPPLRAAIAAHLQAWRGLSCHAGQIIITSGASEAFGLITTLFQSGQTVHVEAPCFGPMLDRLTDAGLTGAPVPVDADGLDPEKLSPKAAAVVLTPSRHYPLGMTLPVARRLAILDWAERANALIIEDDYDSEFRFTGQPLPALASLDRNGRTLYVGSFSKLLSPALRLGYVVVPSRLVPALQGPLQQRVAQASLVPQPALARFMEQGDFAAHLRRMRRLYAHRRQVMLTALATHCADLLIPQAEPSGMHMVCRLGPALKGISDQALARRARAAGIDLRPLSRYPHAPPDQPGFVMGYAAFDDPTIERTVTELQNILKIVAEQPKRHRKDRQP